MISSEIIQILKSINSADIQIVEEGSILVEDILNEIDIEQYKIGNEFDIYKQLKIIAIAETSPLLKDKCFETDIIYLYILINEKDNCIYVGIDFIHPYFWHKIEKKTPEEIKEQLEEIIYIYCTDNFNDNIECDYKFNKKIKGFIGTEKMLRFNYESIENFVVDNMFCEYFMWGSYWNDFPYRQHILNKKYTKFQMERMLTYSMKQRDGYVTISTRTKSSKSIITFEYVNGAILLELKYNPIKNIFIDKYNEITENNFPNDIPLDVIGAVHHFSFVKYKQLLSDPLKIENIALALELMCDQESIREMIRELNIIESNNTDQNILEYVGNMKIILTINLGLNKINIEEINKKILLFWDGNKNLGEIIILMRDWLLEEIKTEKYISDDDKIKYMNHIEKICKNMVTRKIKN